MRALSAAIAIAGIVAVHDISRGQVADAPQADGYPIIAELYSDPIRHADKSVLIYGLVIEIDSGSTFLLQDVSQHPLRIVAAPDMRVAVGDQLMVFGSFHADGQEPFVLAKALIPTQVVAGGGCC
jgi:hypothetical protein